jgi:hypothetical protein
MVIRQKDPIMRFQKGQSGNPAGRPRGSRNKPATVLEKIVAREGQAIVEAAIELAKKGDSTPLRMFIDRLLPQRRHEPVRFKLRPIETPADTVTALADISAGVGDGLLAPSEAAELGKVVDQFVRALTARGYEERLAAIEQSQKARDGAPHEGSFSAFEDATG